MDRQRIELLKELQEKIGYFFTDIDYLNTALTHKTYAVEHGNHAEYNERIEFLGDAVLELSVSDYLYRTYGFKEGSMTKMRAASVSATPLDGYAQKIELGKYMRFGNGAVIGGLDHNKNVLSDAVEAIIGAVYLDGGFAVAKNFVLKQLQAQIGLGVEKSDSCDYKSKLQEFLQKNGNVTIEYRCDAETGLDHEKEFAVSLWVNGRHISDGVGTNKKKAEQSAAQKATIILNQNEGLV